MKNWKKPVVLWLCITMLISLAGCSTTTSTVGDETEAEIEIEIEASEEDTVKEEVSLDGAHVFLFKSEDNPFGTLMYEGFEEYMAELEVTTVYKAPKEATARAQIEMLEELISQNVGSITISASGDEGYDEVFEKAHEAGIPVVSVDSEVNTEYRICHVEQALSQEIGSYLVQAAVLITLGIDYPGDGKMEATVKEELDKYSGEKIQLGILSSSEDSPAQSEWIAAIEEELEKDFYSDKVSSELDIKYGHDDDVESKVQAGAFLREDKVDCIISPTTVGLAAAAQVLNDNNSKVKLTGLGLPSEMQEFMPLSEEEDAFESVCPYMILWDVSHLGATAAAAICAAVNDGFTGEAGEMFEMNIFRDYEETRYEAYTGGVDTSVLAGVPIIFYKGNMAEWIEVL